MSSLGEQIRKLRLQRGWSQIELAKKLSISNTTLSQYETGVRTPDDALKIKMADLFEVSLDRLMGRPEKEKASSATDDGIKVALFGGEKDVPDEVWDEVKRFAQYAKERYGKK